jgi:hypothetical protein
MQGWDSRRWTGVIGFVWVAVQVVGVVLFLVAGNPPDFGDAKKFTGWINTNSGLLMGDAFLTGIAALPFLGVLVGVRSIIRSAGQDWEWAATLFYGAGTVSIAVLIVGAAAEATSAFVSGSGTEPTTVRAVWAATQMVLTFVYFPSALVIGISAYATYRTAILPRWFARLSGVAAVLVLVAGLTIFGGTGGNGPIGLLPYILGALPVFVWAAALSGVLVSRAASPILELQPGRARPPV